MEFESVSWSQSNTTGVDDPLLSNSVINDSSKVENTSNFEIEPLVEISEKITIKEEDKTMNTKGMERELRVDIQTSSVTIIKPDDFLAGGSSDPHIEYNVLSKVDSSYYILRTCKIWAAL